MGLAKAEQLPDQLRRSIVASGLSSAELARRSGVDLAQVLRFVSGERDIRLETAGRICEALGLNLATAARARGRPSKPTRRPTKEHAE